jgi:phage shock protein A
LNGGQIQATFRQEEFHERLAELQHQSRQAKDELGHCREEVTQLEWKLREKAAEIQRLAKEVQIAWTTKQWISLILQLAIARRQAEQAARRLGEALSQAEQGQRRLEEQKAELERRAAQLEAAEETQARLEQTVKELRTEVKALRNRVELLEVERDGLRAQAESQASLTGVSFCHSASPISDSTARLAADGPGGGQSSVFYFNKFRNS